MNRATAAYVDGILSFGGKATPLAMTFRFREWMGMLHGVLA